MHTIGVLTTDSELAAIWPAWEALWRRIPGACPFSAPAWLRPWWNVFGTGRPVVASMHGPAGPVGLLPLYRLEDKLLPMGVGISDYFDVLLAPEAPIDAASALLNAALQVSDAPRCDLPELSPNAHLLHANTPTGWHDDWWISSPCPVLPMQPEPAIPKGRRRDLRQARHRADRAGGWSVQCADSTCCGELLDALVALHGKCWQARGQCGVLADPRVLAFHRAAVPLLLQAGLLRMRAIRLRGRIAAVAYAMSAADRIFLYLTGYDPDTKFESPGILLLGHMLEVAAGEGKREAHFLRGDEPYKYAWGGVTRRNTGRSLRRES
jgi:CelD/BcsL family acetyltransferase involved in cellulose biosynthesis